MSMNVDVTGAQGPRGPPGPQGGTGADGDAVYEDLLALRDH